MDGDRKELFGLGTVRTEPYLYPLVDRDIIILKDEMQIILDANAKPTQTQPLYWSDLPSSVEYVPPYIVALLPK